MMLRKPSVQRVRKGIAKALTRSVPAPVGGWNARDSEANMPETDATILENWIPGTSSVDTRRGAADWATEIPYNTKSLLPYNPAGSGKLFAGTNGGIFDVTSDGVVGAAAVACTDGGFQSINFTNSSGSYLIAVNGVDSMLRYDGAAWTSVSGAITGVATTDLCNITVFKHRIWFVKKNSLSAFYLGIDAIQGAATEFPLGPIFQRGGHLVAMSSWTVDGGDGADDYLVFITSSGELAVYKGTDPASLSTFSLVGVYFIGEPLGKNCLIKYGGDVLALTMTGIFPLSKALQSTTVKRDSAITDKIQKAFSDAAAAYGDEDGWCGVVFPRDNLLIINYPTSGLSKQFVMNTITGAWCLFSGWNISALCLFGKEIYMGRGATVAKAFTGYSDFGSNIIAKARQAYSYFGSRGIAKHFTLVRPMLRVDNAVNIQLGLNVDFEDFDPISSSLFGQEATSVWDSGDKWDASKWSPEFSIRRQWHTIFARTGYCAALRLRIASNAAKVSWTSTDYAFEVGGIRG